MKIVKSDRKMEHLRSQLNKGHYLIEHATHFREAGVPEDLRADFSTDLLAHPQDSLDIRCKDRFHLGANQTIIT